MTDLWGALERKVRAIVVYRHALLRDLAVRVLSNAGVEVAAALRSEDLSLAALQTLRPDVIVVDQDAEEILGSFGQATVFNQEPISPAKVVTIGLTGTTMVVCCKRLVPDATAESLVQAVAGVPPVAPNKPGD